MKHICILIFSCIALTAFGKSPYPHQIDLSGEWSFALDPEDVGLAEQWQNRSLTEKIKLPGSLQAQGYGEDITLETQWTGQIIDSTYFKSDVYAKYRQPDNIKIPFWLQPEKHYVGVAWYQREIDIPAAWKNKTIELELERAHWQTSLFVNGKQIGENESLLTPHRYILNGTGKQVLTLRVDNRLHIPVGMNAHSVSDHTQTNWNGIIGNISLSEKPALYLEQVDVYPDVKAKKAKVVIALAGKATSGKATIELQGKTINASRSTGLKPVTVGINPKNQSVVTIELAMGDDMLTWSEFAPNLYQLQVALQSKEGTDSKEITFGMREIKAEGTRFYLNGRPIFFRGTLESAIFPLTGYPSTHVSDWERIYDRCKEFGLNHVRFHSWCPPEVAFEVADRKGIYLQIECGGWATVGNGEVQDEWFYAESDRIVKAFGNHPSFCLMAYGNEPAGPHYTEYLSQFVDYWKAKDTRRVYTTAAGWPYVPNAGYWNTPDPRIQAWGAELKSIINAEPPKTDYDFRTIIHNKPIPTISHEIGQWCAYPDFKEIPQYTGVLKAKNFEIFQESLIEHQMGDLAGQFLYASGRLQTLCYKADIEGALRTPGFAGFQLLDLHDFPGQGTALVGVLNAFWEPKGYVDSKEYTMFCNRTVPLARMSKLIWTNNETFKASIEIAHFGEQPASNASIEWEITGASKKVLAGGKTTRDLPIDNCIPVSDIEWDLSSISEPAQLVLTVKVPSLQAENQWNFWVYPEKEKAISSKPYLTTDYEDALTHARSGENVLYCLNKETLRADKGGNIGVGFSSIFWNTAWSRKQAPHELGVYCDPNHPVFAGFPNDGYSDYQWWEIVTGSAAMVLDDFPADVRPLVHLIDDWFTNRKLGILLEMKAGTGKMVVCSADIVSNLEQRPAARQFRRSIEQYMASRKFNPSQELDQYFVKIIKE
ncbi:beta-galactosidase [Bacteroidia bacterium]|nr:beta-galactosidase [Bacteroidia bacterium]